MSERSYDLIARLGRGGMGVVDLARDENGNKVALKRLTLQGSASEIARARQRLLREADVLRKLHHPNVVGLLDVIDEGDEIVLVMPYMSGGSLAERVAQHGPAPADEVERQARRLVGALASAHAAGIVHRDIKPANVLFDERGEPCLADFGVAISRDHTHGLTVAGMVVGTPGFMAPEQARGEAVSPATDVFSLGATLLFAATGDGPFGQGDPGLLMVRAAGGKVEKVPRSLPGSLRTLLRRMLHPRPERRPTAAELAVEGSRTAAVRAAIAQHRPEAGARAWAAVGAGAAAVALVAGVMAVNAARDGTSVDSPAADGGATTEAPGTDGERCLDDHDDYDGLAANGCEAVPDDQDGRTLETTIEANIVPRDDVDRYPVQVDDTMQMLCDGTVEIVLEAPEGMSLSLELVDREGVVVGAAIATSDAPGVVTLGEEQCGEDDKTMFEVVVRGVGGERVADDYVLTRSGDF